MSEHYEFNVISDCQNLLKVVFGYVPYQFEKIKAEYVELAIAEVLKYYPCDGEINANAVFEIAVSKGLSEFERLLFDIVDNDGYNEDIPELAKNKIERFANMLRSSEIEISDVFETYSNGSLDSSCYLNQGLPNEIYGSLYFINKYTDLIENLENDLDLNYSDMYEELKDAEYIEAGIKEYAFIKKKFEEYFNSDRKNPLSDFVDFLDKKGFDCYQNDSLLELNCFYTICFADITDNRFGKKFMIWDLHGKKFIEKEI